MRRLDKPGYSLMELIVSISIMVTMTAVFLVNYNTHARSNKLVQAGNDLASIYRLALNNGLGLVKYNNVVPAGGWGVHISTISSNTSYVLFADLNNNQQYNTGEGVTSYGGRTVNLPDGIVIQNDMFANNTLGNTPVQYADVVFMAPHPTIYIETIPTHPNAEDLLIVFEDESSNFTKVIAINFLGLVDIVN